MNELLYVLSCALRLTVTLYTVIGYAKTLKSYKVCAMVTTD